MKRRVRHRHRRPKISRAHARDMQICRMRLLIEDVEARSHGAHFIYVDDNAAMLFFLPSLPSLSFLRR